MFLGFIRARRRRAAAAESESAALTPESSGLDARQLETGARALRLLRLVSRRNALSPGDLLDFLRAVGLVRAAALLIRLLWPPTLHVCTACSSS